MVRVEPNFAESMEGNSGACFFVLSNFTEPQVARQGMQAAINAVYSVPHPEEPSEPLPNYVSDLSEVDGTLRFWADCKDELDDPGTAEAVATALVHALNLAGADGDLSVGGYPDDH